MGLSEGANVKKTLRIYITVYT